MILSQKATFVVGVRENGRSPPKDEEPAETWAEVTRKTRPARQAKTAAAEKANARTYPRPRCDLETKPNCLTKKCYTIS